MSQFKARKNPIFHKSTIKELKDVECWDDDHNYLHLHQSELKKV